MLVGPLRRGFALPADRLIVVAEEEIFGARAAREARPASKASGLGDLGEIAEGDLIVHDEHGIGRYRGLKKLTVRGVPQDFLQLEYDGGAIYLPVYRIGLVNRYSGGETDAVRLDKLGARTWQEKRRRVSAEARKIAEELMQLYAQRAALAGHAFPRARRGLPRVRGDLPLRGDARSGEGHRRRSSPTCRTACRWIASSAATSATARPRWRCARR